MNKTLNKYIAALDYVGKTLFVSLGACSGISLFSFATVIGTLLETVSDTSWDSINLVFLVNDGIGKTITTFLKTVGKTKLNIKKLLCWLGVDCIV